MKAKELRSSDIAGLQKQLEDLLREQFNLRMQRGVGQLTRPSRMKAVRRDIARVKTVMAQMKAGSK
ncbi:MAG: 50S ribosomal protein L29 [Chromatiaceae bacterium]|jgi:large subunit ribosomal protein L29